MKFGQSPHWRKQNKINSCDSTVWKYLQKQSRLKVFCKKKGVLKNFRDSFLIKLQIRGPYIKRYLNINILSVQNFKNLIFEILKFHFKHQELENHSCKVYINLIITLESLLNLLLKRCWGRSRLILPLSKYFGSRVRCNVAQTAGVRQWKS